MVIELAILGVLRWPLEALSLLALIGIALLIKMSFAALPERIPHHFSITGRPDRYGRRWLLPFTGVLALAMYAGMSIGGDTLGLVSGSAAVKPGEAFMFAWTKAIMLLLFCHFVRSIIRVALSEAGRMNMIVLWGLIALMLVPFVAGVVK